MINTNHIIITTTYYAFGEGVKLLPHYFIFYCGHFFLSFFVSSKPVPPREPESLSGSWIG